LTEITAFPHIDFVVLCAKLSVDDISFRNLTTSNLDPGIVVSVTDGPLQFRNKSVHILVSVFPLYHYWCFAKYVEIT